MSNVPILNKEIKGTAMMRGKSQPSEQVSEKIKPNNTEIKRGFGKGDNFIFCQNIILSFILIIRTKTQQIKQYAQRTSTHVQSKT